MMYVCMYVGSGTGVTMTRLGALHPSTHTSILIRSLPLLTNETERNPFPHTYRSSVCCAAYSHIGVGRCGPGVFCERWIDIVTHLDKSRTCGFLTSAPIGGGSTNLTRTVRACVHTVPTARDRPDWGARTHTHTQHPVSVQRRNPMGLRVGAFLSFLPSSISFFFLASLFSSYID